MREDTDPKGSSHDKLRKIQNYVPGFMGYGVSRSIRDADRLLRIQLSQKISLARRELDEAKRALVEHDLLTEMDDIESLSKSLKRIDGEVSYAETGYGGLGDDYGVGDDILDMIYDHDVTLLDGIGILLRHAGDIKSSARLGEVSSLRKHMNDFKARIGVIEEAFIRRMALMGKR
jgi:hypothetical protein